MDKISKALGAAGGGFTAGIAVVGAIVGLMPAEVAAGIPWWGYFGMVVVTTVVPAAVTYKFPANA